MQPDTSEQFALPARDLAEGLQGPQIGEALAKARIAAIARSRQAPQPPGA